MYSGHQVMTWADLVEQRRLRRARNPGKRTFADRCCYARVVSVYDGDTIKILTRLDTTERHWEYPLRVAGIDTPELRPSRALPDRDLHIRAAGIARDQLAAKLPIGSIVRVVFHSEDKLGRLLGRIFTVPRRRWWRREQSVDVSEWMIAEGLAHTYDGGTKTEFTREELEAIVAKTPARISRV
jgi:endonuclease YncB( thermonuclease family)